MVNNNNYNCILSTPKRQKLMTDYFSNRICSTQKRNGKDHFDSSTSKIKSSLYSSNDNNNNQILTTPASKRKFQSDNLNSFVNKHIKSDKLSITSSRTLLPKNNSTNVNYNQSTCMESEFTSVTSIKDDINSVVTSTFKKDKPLSINEIKEKLRGCKNLTNLKQQLASINDCAEKVKQFKSMKIPVLSPIKLAQSPRKVSNPEKLSLSSLTMIPSPLKSPITIMPSTPNKLSLFNCIASPFAKEKLSCSRKLFDSSDDSNSCDSNNNNNNKTPENIIPAYLRFPHLLKAPKKVSTITSDKNDVEINLPLPAKYNRIGDLFKRLDYFVWHYMKRHETCTFDKLKPKIELASGRQFDLLALLKILTVLARNGKKWFALDYYTGGGQRQLTFAPLYPVEQIKSINSISMLFEREKEFNQMLLELTKEEHLKFLAEMKLVIDSSKKIYSWHPMFQLDSVSDIVPDMTLLPKQNSHNNKNILATPSQKSILNYLISQNNNPNNFIDIVDNNNENNTNSRDLIISTTPSLSDHRLKGIPLHLLNKVLIMQLCFD